MKDTMWYLIAGVLVLALVWLTDRDFRDEIKAGAYHCDMVAQWNAGAAAGVPEIDRAGWPDYKGTCNK